jgi:signal transduction histidine kinase
MFRPPQSLLAALAATTVVVTAALCWAGWQLLDQQRAIDEQRARERLEATAEALASNITGRLAEAGEWLSVWVSSPPSVPPVGDGAVALAIADGRIDVVPPGGLPYVPPAVAAPRRTNAFDELERVEFANARLGDAAAGYRLLASTRDVHVRAGAWFRLGRVLRRSGDLDGALAAYGHLTDMKGARVGDLPAALAGLLGQRAVHLARGDGAGAANVGSQVLEGLDGGRWLITRGEAEFYRDQVGAAGPPASWRLAEALSDAWQDAGGHLTPRGHRVFRRDDRIVLAIWRSSGRRSALLAAFADTLFVLPVSAAGSWQLVDPEGQPVAGAGSASGRPVTRVLGASEYPWTLQLWPSPPADPDARVRQRLLVGMTAAMVLFVWAASYFIARAVRREAEVARLQSNFVAAVSHEFRSPLTAVRQMAEMLEIDRLPSDARRHTYYRAIAGEAARLQRLVETLLNFGRMEAGAARYQFTKVDLAAVARAVAADLEPAARVAETRIESAGPDTGPYVRADEQALSLALRNLIDNAIKYSPGRSTISVQWREEAGQAAIDVVDRGAGIDRREQQAIFRKFVRGRAAVETNVPGTGVGLSMVREIVRAHHGRVLVDSEVGQGSTFTIELPVFCASTEGEV